MEIGSTEIGKWKSETRSGMAPIGHGTNPLESADSTTCGQPLTTRSSLGHTTQHQNIVQHYSRKNSRKQKFPKVSDPS